MADFILVTGDQAIFKPKFGQAIVTPIPGTLIGSGKAKVDGRIICVNGDEKKVIVPGCPYMTSQFNIPGMGILSIRSLAANQKARKVKSGGKPVLLKGTTFTAKFQVVLPAMKPLPPPAPPLPDPVPIYSGTGNFLTLNFKVRAT